MTHVLFLVHSLVQLNSLITQSQVFGPENRSPKDCIYNKDENIGRYGKNCFHPLYIFFLEQVFWSSMLSKCYEKSQVDQKMDQEKGMSCKSLFFIDVTGEYGDCQCNHSKYRISVQKTFYCDLEVKGDWLTFNKA